MSCRFINPSKTDIRKISKQILDRVSNNILEKNKVNQWKNTSSVIEWYRNIMWKFNDQCYFVVFDIESFYPSISTKLFDEVISFAKLYDVTSDELEFIMHSRKTLFGKIVLGLKKRAMKILTHQWHVMMVQKYANWYEFTFKITFAS